MRGMRAITIVLAIGLGHAAAWGDPPAPDTSAPPAAPQDPPKPAPKVPPAEYLKAGAKLFNKGDVKKAEKYFKAAQRSRDDLSKSQQVVLDTYLEEVAKQIAAAAKPPTDPAVAPASMTVATPATPAAGAMPKASERPRPAAFSARLRFQSTDPKQRARWMLQEARDFIRREKLEEAVQKVAEARALDVKWGRLDDSPDKVAKAIEYARKNAPQAKRTPSIRPLGIRRLDPASTTPAGPGTPADGPGGAPGS